MITEIKNKIVYIKDDKVLLYLKEYKDMESDIRILFKFKKIDDKTYLEKYCDKEHHIIYYDENRDGEINGIYYNKILILDYKKL